MRFKTLFLPIILFLLGLPAQSTIIDRIAAIVNEHVITQSEVNAIQQLGLHASGLPDTGNPLQNRINHHLVLQQIERQPPLAIPEEIIQGTVESFTKEHGGNEEFLLFLNSVGMNYEDFYSELNEQLSIREFITIRFRPFVNVQIEEAETYYNDVYRPSLEKEGKEAPSFAESFDEIQALLAESRVRKRTEEWLAELRQESSVYVKE